MGCDIHLYVERREDGKWVSADRWQRSKYENEPGLRVDWDHRFYRDRNYRLFTALAGVRDYDQEGKSQIISPPKGLPDDVCALVKKSSDEWDGDGHSHSWLTLAELETYDWSEMPRFKTDVMDILPHTGNPEDVRIVFWFDN